MKKIVTFIFLVGITMGLYAQQQGQYSQYMMNYYLINPAIAGLDDNIDIRLGYRNQWTGLAGAPQNYYLTIHSPLNKIHGHHSPKFSGKKSTSHHSIGGSVNGQTLGAIAGIGANLSYAFHLPLDVNWTLSTGITGGIIQYSLNQSKLDFGDANSDIATSNFNRIKPNLNLGLWLYSKKIFGGISTSQIFEGTLGYEGKLQRHYYFTAGGKFKTSKEMTFIPSFLFKTVPNSAYQLDINAKLKYLNICWGGLSYRHKDAIALMLGVDIQDRYELGYSYDATTSALRSVSYGSHEIMLGIKLGTQAQIHSPSDFW